MTSYVNITSILSVIRGNTHTRTHNACARLYARLAAPRKRSMMRVLYRRLRFKGSSQATRLKEKPEFYPCFPDVHKPVGLGDEFSKRVGGRRVGGAVIGCYRKLGPSEGDGLPSHQLRPQNFCSAFFQLQAQ